MARATCLVCLHPLPEKRTAKRQTCSGACRIRLCRLRTRERQPEELDAPGNSLPAPEATPAAEAMAVMGAVFAGAAASQGVLARAERAEADLVQCRASFETEQQKAVTLQRQLDYATTRNQLLQRRVEDNDAQLDTLWGQLERSEGERAQFQQALGEARQQADRLPAAQEANAVLREQLRVAAEQAQLLAETQQANRTLRKQLAEATDLRQRLATVEAAHERARALAEGYLLDREVLRTHIDQSRVNYQTLAAERDALRRQLAPRSTLGQQLEAATQLNQQLTAQGQESRQLLAAWAESYEALCRKHNAWVDQVHALRETDQRQYEALRFQFNHLVGQYNDLGGLHDDQLREYNALGDRFSRFIATNEKQYEALVRKYNALVGEYHAQLRALPASSSSWAGSPQRAADNAQLRSERDWLFQELTEKAEVVALLQATVTEQQAQLESRETQRALPGAQTRGRARRESAQRHSQKERIHMATREEPSSLWGSIAKVFGEFALAGAATAVSIRVLETGGRAERALPAAEKSEPHRIGGNSRLALPP